MIRLSVLVALATLAGCADVPKDSSTRQAATCLNCGDEDDSVQRAQATEDVCRSDFPTACPGPEDLKIVCEPNGCMLSFWHPTMFCYMVIDCTFPTQWSGVRPYCVSDCFPIDPLDGL